MNKSLTKVVLAISVLALASLACGAFSSLFGGPLIQDDFSNTSGTWGVGTDIQSSVEYANGGLQFQVYSPDYFTWSTPNTTDYENVHIEVTAIHNDANPTTAFGVICHEQTNPESHYYFVITPSGEYGIVKAEAGQADILLTNNDQIGFSELIPQDATSYRVGADCASDGRLTLYVDGQQIDSVTDSSYTTGRVGLITWSGEEAPSADVVFDDFVVTRLQ